MLTTTVFLPLPNGIWREYAWHLQDLALAGRVKGAVGYNGSEQVYRALGAELGVVWP